LIFSVRLRVMKFGDPSSPLSHRSRATTFHVPVPILPFSA
jgi:hypothetical protein